MFLVTGGTGFVGKHIVNRLVSENQSVRVLARKLEILHHPNVSYVQGDISNLDSLKSAMHGCSVVIHLVGIIRESGNSTFERVHIEGTQNVVEAAQETGVQKIVHMSALGTRANASSRYHRSKWSGEEVVRKSGIPYLIFRPSIIVGPEDNFINFFVRMMKSPFSALSRIVPVIGNGRSKFQPIWVEDVAHSFVKGATSEIVGEYDLAGPEVYAFDELLDLIMRVTNIKRKKVHLPFSIASLIAAVSERFPGSVLTRDQLLMLQEDNVGDNRPMIHDFAVTPTPIENVLREYL